MSEGQWIPTKTRAMEIKKQARKNKRPAPHPKFWWGVNFFIIEENNGRQCKEKGGMSGRKRR